MGMTATLRVAVGVVLTEAKNRTTGVLDAVEDALIELVNTVTEAAETATVTIIGTVFNLMETVVIGAFGVAEALVDAALGRLPSDGPNPSTDEEAN